MRQQLPALTGLRFPLALWVMLHHLSGQGGALEAAARSLPHPLFALIRGGYLAVTIFFALSGFVLAEGYGSRTWRREQIGRYFIGRFARIYPVYLLSLVIVAPFILADQTPGKAGFVGAYALLLQGWIRHLPVDWNTPAWSLSCEVFFYLCFPIAVPAMRRVHPAAIAVTAALFNPVLFLLGMPDQWKPVVHFADFLMGIAAAAVYDRLRNRVNAAPLLYIPATIAIAALIAWPGLLPSRLDLNSAIRPFNGVLLVGLAVGTGLFARMLASPPFVYLGKASYAMYILHVPVLWWMKRWSPAPPAGIYIALVILLSILVYRYCEEPANRYIRGLIEASPRPRERTLVALDANLEATTTP
ncbi:MAG: acyltransferase [Acidobacteriia bacterium]|nr:acyltransferase [Terriglobia bacterium]